VRSAARLEVGEGKANGWGRGGSGSGEEGEGLRGMHGDVVASWVGLRRMLRQAGQRGPCSWAGGERRDDAGLGRA
jgi:hypothetical protein